MKIIHTQDKYLSGTGTPALLGKYDFCLFRQDFNGNESVLFSTEDIDNVINMISEGEILIHNNYSILYVSKEDSLEHVSELFPCYCTKINRDM